MSAPRVCRVTAGLSESRFGDDLAESCRAWRPGTCRSAIGLCAKACRLERLSERPPVTSRTGVLNPWADGKEHPEMQATPTTTYAGIDWSWQHHALCIVDDDGHRSRRRPFRTPSRDWPRSPRCYADTV